MGHGVFIRAVQIEISNSNSQLFFVTANWHPWGWFLSSQREKKHLRGTRLMPPATGAPFSTSSGGIGMLFTKAQLHFSSLEDDSSPWELALLAGLRPQITRQIEPPPPRGLSTRAARGRPSAPH